MRIEEMLAASDRAATLAQSEQDAIKAGVFQQAAFTWLQHAALCERLDAQTEAQRQTNALLERIASALEASEMNTRRNTL